MGGVPDYMYIFKYFLLNRLDKICKGQLPLARNPVLCNWEVYLLILDLTPPGCIQDMVDDSCQDNNMKFSGTVLTSCTSYIILYITVKKADMNILGHIKVPDYKSVATMRCSMPKDEKN